MFCESSQVLPLFSIALFKSRCLLKSDSFRTSIGEPIPAEGIALQCLRPSEAKNRDGKTAARNGDGESSANTSEHQGVVNSFAALVGLLQHTQKQIGKLGLQSEKQFLAISLQGLRSKKTQIQEPLLKMASEDSSHRSVDEISSLDGIRQGGRGNL